MPVELAEPLLPAGGAPRSLLARLRSRCPENFSLVATAGTLFAIAATCWFLADALAEPPSPSPEAMENATLASACTDRESCLRIVDAYMENQPRQDFFGDPKVGLLQTFGPNSVGGGPCGDKLCKLVEPCPNFAQTPHCRYDVYDNALAAIYLAKRGKIDAARQILDAFITLLYPPHSIADITIDAKDGLPSNRSIALLAAGFTDAPTRAGMYAGAGVADGALDTGNNAWVGMAFAHFAAASGEACYADVARDILYALKFRASCDGKLGGFASRFKPYPHFYRSTEHNIDMFALSTMLGDKEAAKLAHQFVSGMYEAGKASGSYATGTADAEHCDNNVPDGPSAVDAQFWNLLAGADAERERKESSIGLALQSSDGDDASGSKSAGMGLWAEDIDRIGNAHGEGKGAKLQGVRFSTWGNGVQWENTASAAMASVRYLTLYGDEASPKGVDKLDVAARTDAARSSLRNLLSVYRCIPASVLGGNIAAWVKNDHASHYPGGSDTGIGWTYLRYPHAAATAWTGLLMLYQWDKSAKVDEDANPFAPPKRPIPPSGGGRYPAGASCFPGKPDSGAAGASCKANKGCQALDGNCCPNDGGDMLACCG